MTFPIGKIKTSADLLAIARAMEERSAERYRDLAEAFAMSCNRDTAEAFRQLAAHEDQHAAEFPTELSPDLRRLVLDDSPEIADPGSVHYLMLPWHAFDLALRHEERALALFESLVPVSDIGTTAHDLAERKRAHITEMRARRESCPTPPPGWWEDADEPNWDA